MNYEWDKTKSAANKVKHGIPFEDMAGFDWDFSLCLDIQLVDGEERELWIGPIASALFAVVTVDRAENTVRIVSLRRASRFEKTEWKKEFQHG